MGLIDLLGFRKQATPAVNREVRITEAHYVVVDTELTGLSERKDSIVSIGAIKMAGRKIALGDAFYKLVHPETDLRAESIVIHEITPSDVSEKPPIDVVLKDFLDYCGEDIFVGYCVAIDLTFINKEVKRLRGSKLRNPAIDVFNLYEWLRTKETGSGCFTNLAEESNLYKIARCFGIPVQGAHDAMMDAYMTAQLFQRFIPILIGEGVEKLGDLLDIGDPYGGGERFKAKGNIANF